MLNGFKIIKEYARKYHEEFGEELDLEFREYLKNNISRIDSRNYIFVRTLGRRKRYS